MNREAVVSQSVGELEGRVGEEDSTTRRTTPD